MFVVSSLMVVGERSIAAGVPRPIPAAVAAHRINADVRRVQPAAQGNVEMSPMAVAEHRFTAGHVAEIIDLMLVRVVIRREELGAVQIQAAMQGRNLAPRIAAAMEHVHQHLRAGIIL